MVDDLAGQPVDWNFQPVKLDPYSLEENAQLVEYEKELHTAGQQHSVRVAEVLTGHNCPSSDIRLLGPSYN